MIGKDFLPNDFLLFGLDLTDPTDFIYDVVLGILAFYYAYKISRFSVSTDFFKYWKSFFFYFGLATFLSAFGHLFYNYFYYFGKLPGWLFIPISTYWIERAMLSPHKNNKLVEKLKKLFLFKLITIYIVCFVVWLNIDPLEKPHLLFLPIAIDTVLGLILIAGYFCFKFSKEISSNFKYILFGILVILPSVPVFMLKINLHQWFSKNDFSHILMLFGITFFYFGVKKIQNEKSFLIKDSK